MVNRPVSRARWGLCWGTIAQATATELIRVAANAGFQCVALSTVAHRGLLEDGGRAVRSLCETTGVTIESIDPIIGGLPGLPAASDLTADLAVYLEATAKQAIRMAEAVHATSVNIAHFLGRPETSLDRLIETIGSIVEHAARRGVDVTLEFIPGTGIPDLATAARIVDAIGVPELRVLLDVWHLARSGGTVEDVALLAPHSIGWVQLSDRIEPEPGAAYVPMSGRLMPGAGALPLDALLMATLTNSPGIAVCAEVFDTAHNEQRPADIADRAAEAMRSLGFSRPSRHSD